MPDNLGQVVRCVSRVNTRLRYVHKSMEISGSPKMVVTLETTTSLERYVVSASTDLNVLNGVSIMKDTESGVDYPQQIEELSVVN